MPEAAAQTLGLRPFHATRQPRAKRLSIGADHWLGTKALRRQPFHRKEKRHGA